MVVPIGKVAYLVHPARYAACAAGPGLSCLCQEFPLQTLGVVAQLALNGATVGVQAGMMPVELGYQTRSAA